MLVGGVGTWVYASVMPLVVIYRGFASRPEWLSRTNDIYQRDPEGIRL